MKPLYIFDLDGTLALIEHRRHFVERPSLKCYDCGGANFRNCVQCGDLDENWRPNWDAFHDACVDDLPNEPIITLLNTLSLGADIWIFSGRMGTVVTKTTDWLTKHDIMYTKLRMRVEKDYTADDVLKQQWYDELSGNDKRRLVCTFDDRDRIVEMWRRNGVVCCQVAPGDF